MKNITCIGGATGSSIILNSLKGHNYKLTAIYPVTDDGGSAGRLINDYGTLPTGDLRRLMATLSNNKSILTNMLLYRFAKGELKGHALGAIMLTALIDITGSTEKAILEMKKILNIKHDILPSSLKKTTLCAKLANNKIIKGENKIDEVIGFNGKLKIKELFLEPPVAINPKAKKAIINSDVIIIGPGDLHTSILPNILVAGAKKAIKESKAKIIYVCNIMTKFGQTNNFKVSDFVSEIESYLGKKILDYIIYNTKKPTMEILKAHKNEDFVKIDKENFSNEHKYIGANLISKKVHQKSPGDILKRSIIKHDPQKIEKVLLSII